MQRQTNARMGENLDITELKKASDSIGETFIDTPQKLDTFIGEVRRGDFRWCAADTEADSMHSFETKLCLIQFAVSGRLAIIDPLLIENDRLLSLLDLMDDAEVVWMHGADYDMSMFRKTFDRIPRKVWDTQTAARLTGVEQFGLANLIETEFGVSLSKQSQKANWGRRPLTEKMLKYAFNDVRYMLPLARILVTRLEENSRIEWFEESCDAAREAAAGREEKPTDDAWRVTGWGNLDRKGLHFLKALWHWRNDECRRLDRPAFKLVSNQILMSAAECLQKGESVKPPKQLRPAMVRRFESAIEEAGKVPEKEWPKKFRRNGGLRLQIDEDRFRELRNRRNRIGSELGIDPTLIAPRAVLEKLAADNLDPEEKESLLLRWQRVLLNGDA